MKVAFDTSVIVPALVPALPMHSAAYAWIRAAVEQRIEGSMSWHAFAEAWAVITRIPNLKPAPTPATARDSLSSLQKAVRRSPLGPRVYQAAVERCVERGLRSGAVFDALHLVAAERQGAQLFVTANVRHFERLASDESPRILPPDTPPEEAVRKK
jgi:predicted nucleic acid-binding protein